MQLIWLLVYNIHTLAPFEKGLERTTQLTDKFNLRAITRDQSCMQLEVLQYVIIVRFKDSGAAQYLSK